MNGHPPDINIVVVLVVFFCGVLFGWAISKT